MAKMQVLLFAFRYGKDILISMNKYKANDKKARHNRQVYKEKTQKWCISLLYGKVSF
jgi:hypothetical protein